MLLQAVLGLSVVVIALGLVPGTDRIMLTEPFAGISINTGKLLAVVVLGGLVLAMGPWRCTDHSLPERALQVTAMSCAVVLLACSIYLWLTQATPDFGARTAVLLGINLTVTCVAEELLFRRWLLCQQLRIQPPLAALATNSVIFGAAHLLHSIELAVLATIAGALYGAIFLLYRMVWLAVLVHWPVNLPLLIFWLT
jgi:membrane protease YdiL (CAAX protease family)